MNQQAQSHSPSLQRTLFSAIDAALGQVHTALPAIIDKYDHATQTAEVKPALRRRFADDSVVELPVIPGVPVLWPGSADGGICWPLTRGDAVMLMFSERSMDEWMANGGVVTPSDGRRFDLTDAVAIPKLVAGGAQGHADNNTDMILAFKSATIRFKSDGEIVINGGNTVTIKANGDVELGTGVVQKLLTESFKTIVFDLHTHPYAAGVTSPPTPIPDPTGITMTSKVVAQ